MPNRQSEYHSNGFLRFVGPSKAYREQFFSKQTWNEAHVEWIRFCTSPCFVYFCVTYLDRSVVIDASSQPQDTKQGKALVEWAEEAWKVNSLQIVERCADSKQSAVDISRSEQERSSCAWATFGWTKKMLFQWVSDVLFFTFHPSCGVSIPVDQVFLERVKTRLNHQNRFTWVGHGQ